MRRPSALLFVFFLVSTQASAQEPASPPKPSDNEKQQAQAALNTARDALFPLRRKPETALLLTRIAPLLAATGDFAAAQDVVALLPANQRDGVQPEIIGAQLRAGELSAALQLAAAIADQNTRAAALLQVAQAQAATKDFAGASRTAASIGAEHPEYPQALLGIASALEQAGKGVEAAQFLRQAAAAAANLDNSSDTSTGCSLALLTQVANAQKSIEPAEALKTLRLIGEQVSDADPACRYAVTNFLPDDNSSQTTQSDPLRSEIAQLRNRAFPSEETGETEAQEVQEAEDAPAPENLVAVRGDPLILQGFAPSFSSPSAEQQPDPAANSLRSIRSLHQRAQAAFLFSQRLLGSGKTKEAEEAIQIGLEAGDVVQDDTVRGMLLTSKAATRAAAKDWEGARNVIEGISDPSQRTEALGDIAFRAAAAGQAQLALPWAMAETSPMSEAAVLVAIAEALLHQGHQSRTTLYIH